MKPHGCLGKRLLGRGGIKGKVPRQVWGPLSSRKSKNAKAELSMEGESIGVQLVGSQNRRVFGPGQRLWVIFWVDGVAAGDRGKHGLIFLKDHFDCWVVNEL